MFMNVGRRVRARACVCDHAFVSMNNYLIVERISLTDLVLCVCVCVCLLPFDDRLLAFYVRRLLSLSLAFIYTLEQVDDRGRKGRDRRARRSENVRSLLFLFSSRQHPPISFLPHGGGGGSGSVPCAQINLEVD